uniref:Putative secreted protein n=1 Tax=Anopheles triannulatus TaxID=58253 RepID=A0A2M4B7F2_9DIPT
MILRRPAYLWSSIVLLTGYLHFHRCLLVRWSAAIQYGKLGSPEHYFGIRVHRPEAQFTAGSRGHEVTTRHVVRLSQEMQERALILFYS